MKLVWNVLLWFSEIWQFIFVVGGTSRWNDETVYFSVMHSFSSNKYPILYISQSYMSNSESIMHQYQYEKNMRCHSDACTCMCVSPVFQKARRYISKRNKNGWKILHKRELYCRWMVFIGVKNNSCHQNYLLPYPRGRGVVPVKHTYNVVQIIQTKSLFQCKDAVWPV